MEVFLKQAKPARRVQVGVPIMQVTMGRVQTWGTHSANVKSLKDRLLPPTDQGVSALLDDLATMGLLDETLVGMRCVGIGSPQRTHDRLSVGRTPCGIILRELWFSSGGCSGG